LAIANTDAARSIEEEADAMEDSWAPVQAIIDEVNQALDELDGRQVNVEIVVSPIRLPPTGIVTPPGGGWIPEEGPVTHITPPENVPEFQGGGRFTVPPGFNSTPYYMGVHSGEEVSVAPKGQSGRVINIYYTASGRGTSADAYSLAGQISDELGARG
jgi:hypothetical protein